MLQALDAAGVRQWCATALRLLRQARQEIDDLNVYPVPDGDTGTNLVLTVESVVEALDGAAPDMSSTAAALARGALMGARGNSGVIFAELLRGVADVLAPLTVADGQALQAALVRAAELAYGAVAVPVEGTVLTVAREAAAAAAEIGMAPLPAVVAAARAGAAAALASTTALLPALAAAGVVDAGGRGLCVLLDALHAVVSGQAPGDPGDAVALVVPRDRGGLAAARESGSDAYAYEVQYLLRDASDGAVAALREQLGALGDSVVVVGTAGLHNVHVHVNDVGAALEAGIDAGRPFRVTVTRFADQVAAQEAGATDARSARRAVVAVAPGPRLAGLFTGAGAVVVEGGPSANPSTGELLRAIVATGATEVVLLPNDGNVAAVAGAAAAEARQTGVAVAVVPTRSVLQGLAALAVADTGRTFTDDVGAMAAAAGATRWAEVTTAVREAATMAGICQPGDVLGLIEGDVVLLGRELEQVAGDLVDRMLRGGGELVTVITGEQAPEGAAARLARHIATHHPAVEVHTYDGGQPHYPFLVGVE